MQMGGQVCAITQPMEPQTILAIEAYMGEAYVVMVTRWH
jgi:hypothetical protein